MLTIKAVTKAAREATGCPDIELFRGDGYHYFIFDLFPRGVKVFETHSVMVNRINDLGLESWVAEARDFLGKLFDDRPELFTRDPRLPE